MKWLIVFLLAIGVVFPLEAMTSERGVALKNCKVLKDPFVEAKEIAALKEGDSVDILTRTGGWLNITTRGKTGWVRMLFIRRGMASRKPSAASEATGVLGLATGRSGKGNVVAATGVRGLSENELKGATFNPQELAKLKQYVIPDQEAQSFAKEGGLQPQQVDFLGQPARE